MYLSAPSHYICWQEKYLKWSGEGQTHDYFIIYPSFSGKDEGIINLIASDNKFYIVISPYLKTRIWDVILHQSADK